ncbi:TonB-dependent receptor [Subsaximicrobium wynnwilliamsii]|uniref:TonB-dependent receptor n=1 Tax=Subsaximicrobium wynnwilliamsii TaxID=291179 RepID=A0A5C6ZHK9_9FLAO|nr:TonB-dependent receptor [Subsaximicrobium wynnwilliamsii]TXD82509.1 TonB-dependent receptor [Subsaximicrobium wynnwilliamsii]TXD88152.1 TonB-dependent receptor [Subsaximicrobium wynnwilliamsii]TXE02167.1 TonB-dependent receptor [Subsaximicrobium wynnwilliamsii]
MKTILKTMMLLCCALTFAQTTVKGKVTDNTGQPLPGANIIVVGTSSGTISDFDGNYTLTINQQPPFSIQVSSVGFETITKEVTQNGQTIDFSMAEGTSLDEVIISASRTPERIFESPVTVERFGLKDIKSASSPSFFDSIENLKGVDMNTSSLTFKSVNTRGFASFANTRFMQLVDGMDNSSPALNFALGNFLGMSELDINSVELLPGASSALYGANAFNGIMFMTSKNPFDHQGVSFYAKTGITSSDNAGDNNFVDAGIRVAKAFSDKFAAKASVSFLNGTEWFATDYRDFNDPGQTRLDPSFDGLNIYGDEVSTPLDFDEIAAGALPIPVLTNYGAATVSRTGYEERDLMDYNAESLKADFSLHFKPWANDFEIILNSKIGRGSTIYQGANRYSIKDFFMQQHKLEVRNKNFFARIYTTAEKSGNSYDSRFTGININRAWKADRQWFTEYAGAFIGNLAGQGIFANPTEGQIDAAHLAARAAADTGRLLPGTAEFEETFDRITSDGDLTTGSKFTDNSKIYHGDVNYNLGHVIDFADIQVGGSWRQYSLNSGGTIYTDFDGPIEYIEYGAYTQIQKKLVDDRLKLTGSIRYDKSEFFDGFLSPRLSFNYTADQNDNHNIRGSFQTGFRNPTTQDLFIGLNAGRAILVGSALDNLDRYTATSSQLSASGQNIVGANTVQLNGGDAYSNAFSRASIAAGNPQAANVNLVKPEKVTAYEVGYRGKVNRFVIDMSVYYNAYEDFISNRTVITPLYGEVGDNTLSLLALQNGDFQAYQTYTNSDAEINSYGGSIGVETSVLNGFDFGVSYTYAKLDFDQSQDPDFETSFNTPEHKVKASFGKTDLLKNFGFNVNWRWNDNYLWQSTFADGILPARNIIDAQVNFAVPSIKSMFKVGGANILSHDYVSAPGAGQVGAQYFVSWTINQ